MAETDENQQPRNSEPNWVEKWTLCTSVATFLVLAATLVAVICYVGQMKTANGLTRETLDAQTRPYVFPRVDYQTFQGSTATSEGTRSTVHFTLVNFGKFPAASEIKSRLVYTRAEITSVDVNTSPVIHRFIFPTEVQQPIQAISETEPTPGDLEDMGKGRGHVYVGIVVNYRGHMTKICQKYALDDTTQPRQQPTLIVPSEPCSDPNSNYAN